MKWHHAMMEDAMHIDPSLRSMNLYRENVFGRPNAVEHEHYRGRVNRAQLLWNVHNYWETCTTSLTRAQHLWHVHNISETCTTSLKRSHIEYLKTLGGGGETLVDLTAIGAGWQPESSPDRLRYNEAPMMADSHVCYNHLLWAYL